MMLHMSFTKGAGGWHAETDLRNIDRLFVFLVLGRVYCCSHMIFVARQAEHPLSTEIDLGHIPVGTDNGVGALKLWVRAAGEDARHLHVGQGDQVILVKRIKVQNCVTDLSDIYCSREADILRPDISALLYMLSVGWGDSYLPSVAFCPHTMLIVPQVTCGHWWMVAHLLSNQMGLVIFRCAHIANEDFTKEGIQWFLDALAGLPSGILLRLEAG